MTLQQLEQQLVHSRQPKVMVAMYQRLDAGAPNGQVDSPMTASGLHFAIEPGRLSSLIVD